jgi:hypothetical protein
VTILLWRRENVDQKSTRIHKWNELLLLPAACWCQMLRRTVPSSIAPRGFWVQLTSTFAAQGVVGSLPWQAMVFFTLWLQLLGFSDLAASSLMAVFALGTSFGHVIGGFIGASADERV